MASGPDRLPRYAAPLAVAATALCWWFGTGLQPQWWLAWLAPLPLLLYAARASGRATAFASFAAFALGHANQWHYLHEVIRLPLPIGLMAVVGPALLLVPALLLWRALVRQGRAVAAMFALPAATTGIAWLTSVTSPHGTFGHIAYSQMDALVVIQAAALVGLWGIGFLVWLLPSLLAVATAPTARPRARGIAAASGIAMLALALGYGALRLQDDAADARIRIGLVSIGGSQQAHADIDTPAGQRMLAAYLAEIETLAARGARIVVAPESALLVRTQAIAPLQQLADRRGVRILIGVEDHSDLPRKRNAALVFTPATAAPVHYFKRRLIPSFEDRYTPGDAALLLDAGQGEARIGVAICKDYDFTSTGRRYGLQHAGLMLAPAWDFDADAWLHARMAILRGVENGFAMARSARDGQLTLSDDRGRVLAQASTAGIDAPVGVVGELPLRTMRTPYTRIGDGFGLLCLVAALALAVIAAVRKPR